MKKTILVNTLSMIKKFLYCGILGWCLEILFTSFQSFRRRNRKLIAQTSLWMFPIYGLPAIFTPVFKKCRKLPVLLRGSLYMLLIFTVEYTTGRLLLRFDACPWDYSRAKHQKDGLIRYDYAIWWFLTGLLYEKVLCPWKKHKTSSKEEV